MMGLGHVSGRLPESRVAWCWSNYKQNVPSPNSSIGSKGDLVPQTWLGRVEAGLRIALKGLGADWESPEDMPTSALAGGAWPNCPTRNQSTCRGSISVATAAAAALASAEEAGVEAAATAVMYRASLGELSVQAGAELRLKFDLLVTPLKPVNTSQHFNTK